MHSQKERLAAQLTKPMRTVLLTGAGDINRGYGNGRVVGPTNTIVALMDRGLIQIRGAVHYWTPLGREVARIAFGAGTVRSLDDLHAEALDEKDTRDMHVVSAWQAAPAYRYFTDAVRRAGSFRAAVGALHAEANEDPRQRAERYYSRACCASTLGDVHNRACGTIEARKQWAPAGSAHGEPQCSEACRARGGYAHLLDCPRGALIKARAGATRKRGEQVKAWELRHGLFAPSRYETWQVVQADHAEALAAGARAGRYATRPVAVTSEEFERAIDVALDASTMRNSLYAALRALGMVVQP